MIETPETTPGTGPGRRRTLVVGLVLAVIAAVLIVRISTERGDGDQPATVATAVPAGESGVDTVTPSADPGEDLGDGESPTAVATTAPTTDPSVDAVTSSTAPGDEQPPGLATVPLSPEAAADLEAVLNSLPTGLDTEAINRLGHSGDARVAWAIADLMRFILPGPSGLSAAFTTLTGIELSGNPWREATDLLIAWDTPAPPGFAAWKGRMYTIVEPGWAPFFADEDSLIDWRHVTWGGVFIDDRPLAEVALPCPRGCIPALDDPPLVPASEGDYYADDKLVFAVAVNGEAVAFPKNMMEVHEMVNITIGGRRLGMPYCTLCGSAQAYFTDEVPDSVQDRLTGAETFELRTSGLLSRSNKMMYEFHTRSMFDTFTGLAVSGPLREAGVQLAQTTVVTSRWGDWKESNPHTYIVAEGGGLDRSYPDDPLRGRDDYGPIFPTGDVDERLPVQEKVLGVLIERGSGSTVVAFPVTATRAILVEGGSVEYSGITVSTDGSGLRATGPDGAEIPAHEAFWFAWSQFHPETELWSPGNG